MGTCTRLDFSGLEKNPDRTGNRPILTFMIFLIKSELWGPHGHLHAPRFFGTGKKSRHLREQANFNFHDFFDQKRIMGTTWAPARALIFRDWKKITKPTGTGQFEFALFSSQISNYGEQKGTCIIEWFLQARDKIRKTDPQNSRLLREQANFRTPFSATAHL